LINVNWGDGSTPDLMLPMTSGSMCQRVNPNLKDSACTIAIGDLILAHSKDPNTITNGTIIVFRPFFAYPYYLVVHRVIRIIPASQSSENQITFWTQGDANGVPDSWDTANGGIPGSQVVGVYQYTLATSSGVLTTILAYDTHRYASIGNSRSEFFAINVTATDNSGSVSVQTVSETVNDRPPSVVISQISPSPTNTGQTVTMSFSAADPDGTLSSVSVNWGDGSAPDVLSGSATSGIHSYMGAGSFTIILTVTDNSGSSSHVSSSPLTVSLLLAPTAPAPTILGLAPAVFYSLIGIIVAIIAAATFLSLRQIRKPMV
jgi:hypothetical protein